jgi:hypothetical protein
VSQPVGDPLSAAYALARITNAMEQKMGHCVTRSQERCYRGSTLGETLCTQCGERCSSAAQFLASRMSARCICTYCHRGQPISLGGCHTAAPLSEQRMRWHTLQLPCRQWCAIVHLGTAPHPACCCTCARCCCKCSVTERGLHVCAEHPVAMPI